jgi:hypothetical protein
MSFFDISPEALEKLIHRLRTEVPGGEGITQTPLAEQALEQVMEQYADELTEPPESPYLQPQVGESQPKNE